MGRNTTSALNTYSLKFIGQYVGIISAHIIIKGVKIIILWQDDGGGIKR